MKVAAAQLPARDLRDRAQALVDVQESIWAGGAAGAQLVLLPECAWPGYVIGSDADARWTEDEQTAALARIAAATREAGVVTVVGMALAVGGVLRHVAVVHEPTGAWVGTVGKRFLWDLETRWFRPALSSEPVDTSVGRLGILICADGRMPEIARSLALQGAQVLLDPTCWVTGGTNPTTWTNPQYEFMLSARAWENRLATIAANKVGVEQGVLAYCGRSVVLDPDGRELAVGCSDGPDLVVATVELSGRVSPRGCPGAGPASLLTRPTGSLPADRLADLPLPTARPRLVVVPGAAPDPSGWTAQLLADLGAVLCVTADYPPPIAFGVANFGVAVLEEDDLDGPEAARAAMLSGADLLVWRGARSRVPEAVLRCRAAENRVFVTALDPDPERVPWALVIDPDGNVRCRANSGRRILTFDLLLADARIKEMAPGTDVVAGRQPEAYASVLASMSADGST